MDTEIYEALIARGYTQAQAISGSKVSFHKFQKKNWIVIIVFILKNSVHLLNMP